MMGISNRFCRLLVVNIAALGLCGGLLQRSAQAGCVPSPPVSVTAYGSYLGEPWKTTPVAVPLGSTVAFKGIATDTDTDPDQGNASIPGAIDNTTWHWTFSDSGTATGQIVSHVCNAIGTFTAQVQVSDKIPPGCKDSSPGTASIVFKVFGGPISFSVKTLRAFCVNPPASGFWLTNSLSSQPAGTQITWSILFGSNKAAIDSDTIHSNTVHVRGTAPSVPPGGDIRLSLTYTLDSQQAGAFIDISSSRVAHVTAVVTPPFSQPPQVIRTNPPSSDCFFGRTITYTFTDQLGGLCVQWPVAEVWTILKGSVTPSNGTTDFNGQEFDNWSRSVQFCTGANDPTVFEGLQNLQIGGCNFSQQGNRQDSDKPTMSGAACVF